MKEILVSFAILLGSFFVLLAAIGVMRFQDLFMRMHAATKAGAFGGGILAIAAGMHFAQFGVWVEAILMVVFFYSTMPIAAHLIALAAHHSGVKPVKRTQTEALERFRP